MNRTINFSKTAENDLKNILEFIEARWSKRSKEIYLLKVEKVLSLIRINPEIFPKSSINKKYHKCVSTKQSTLLYSFSLNEIRVHTIFDTRQDPNKIKKDNT